MKLIATVPYNQDTAYQATVAFLSQPCPIMNDLNPRHISVIAKTALKYVEDLDVNKRVNFKRLEQVIKHIVVSPKAPWTLGIKHKDLSPIQNLILNTLRGTTSPVKEVLKIDYLLSLVWKKNPEILSQARELVKQIFIDMMKQINQKELSSNEAFHMEMIIGDLLSLYSYLSPKQDEILAVPTQIDGKWQMIEYIVDRIPLTPKWMGSPLVAFGLSSKKLDSAPPLFLFKGTTYPTDDGFGLSLITDLNPFASAGKYGFQLGREKISTWLKQHTTNAKARVYGKSLGGALAWQTALGCPQHVEKAMAYGAPGLFSTDLKRCKKLEQQNRLPPIHMFCQESDLIPVVDGVAVSGIQYYKVLGKNQHIGVAAHVNMYSMQEISTILRLNPTEESKRWVRTTLTNVRMIASVSLFPLLVSFYGTKIVAVQTAKFVKYQAHSSLRSNL